MNEITRLTGTDAQKIIKALQQEKTLEFELTENGEVVITAA